MERDTTSVSAAGPVEVHEGGMGLDSICVLRVLVMMAADARRGDVRRRMLMGRIAAAKEILWWGLAGVLLDGQSLNR
jgi:DNA invertase Pin-like site-specific DNA recombinase